MKRGTTIRTRWAPAAPSAASLARRPALAFGCVLALAAPYIVMSGRPRVQAWVLSAAAVAASLLILYRLHRESFLGSEPWVFLASGSVLYALATLSWEWAHRTRVPAFPSSFDLAFLAAYLLWCVFLVAVITGAAGTDRTRHAAVSLVDAAIFTCAASAVLMPEVIAAYLADPTTAGAAKAVAVAYPVALAFLFGLAMLVAVSGAARGVPGGLLLLWVGGELASSVPYSFYAVDNSSLLGHPASLGWFVSLAALAGFAAHPRMNAVLPPRPAPPVTYVWRVWLLLAGPLTPVVVWFLAVHHAPDHSAPFTALGLFALTVSGFVLLLARLQLVSGDLARQRQLREGLECAVSTLREQQEALEISGAVIEATKEAVIVTTVDGEVVQWNSAAEHVYGVPRNEALGDSVLRLYDPETRHVLGELLDEARSEGHASFEKPVLRKDGAKIRVSGSISAISDGAGNVTHFVGISRDVTEAARLRSQLEDSERELREAQRIGGIGSWSWDVAAGKVAWSEEMYRLFALQPQRFTPSLDSHLDLVHPEDRALIEQKVHAILEGVDVEASDYRIVRPDGRVLWLRPRFQVLRDERGVARRLLGTIEDVTASKLAEQELREQRDRLAIYAEVVESIDDAVIVTFTDGTIIAWNRGAAGLYGYTAEEALGRHITLVMSANQTARFGEIMRSLKENDHVRIESVDVRKDGRALMTSVTLSHVRCEDDRPTALVAIARDVTDAKRSEQRLKERLRREREFAGNASHQLRTPLTALRVRIEDLSQWPRLPAAVRDELVASLADINRLSETVAGLLTFSRLGNYWRDDPIELSLAVREAAERWRSSAAEHGRTVRLGPMEPVMVFVPREGVGQVLDILIENAILHGAGEITLEGLVDGAWVRLRVRDEGQGITAMDRERVFARGYRRSGSPGEGIGLSLARELAQSMGARLEVAATPMTAFDLVLPLPRRA